MKNIKRTKKAIIRALKNKERVKDNSKCYLLIIPFCSKEETNMPKFKKYARNLLEVDEEYYKELLEDYKDYKLDEGNKNE